MKSKDIRYVRYRATLCTQGQGSPTSLRSCTWFSARDRVVREGGKQSGILSRRKSKTSSSKCMWAEHQVGKPGTVFETRPRQLSELPCLVRMCMSIYTMSCIIHNYTCRKSDCLGCAVLLCLVCLTLLASFFLPSHLSLKLALFSTCIYLFRDVIALP